MDSFYVAFQITMGVLMPFIIVAAVWAVVIIGRSLPHLVEGWAEEIKQRPPYDEVESRIDHQTKAIEFRFYKGGELVATTNVSDKDMTL